MFYPRNPIIFPPKLAGPFCRAWGLINQHHNQKSMVSFPNSLPSATSRTVHRYTAIKLLKTKIYKMQITYKERKKTRRFRHWRTAKSPHGLGRWSPHGPIGLVRRAGGDGRALRLDSLQSTVLAELIRKELRRLKILEFQGHVHSHLPANYPWLYIIHVISLVLLYQKVFCPIIFEAALGQMQPNTILTLPSNGGFIKICIYI